MAYQVLARKWRPQTFAEVVGQEHISRTLRNAIIHNRIGHAYLFVGSRGIGKTTSARIFAKALNCTDPREGEPCCQCENCRAIADGSSIDVIEFDAASHRGVAELQELREQVKYPPVKCRYKVFIIDEVHMLSETAWNSLLKILEEPPEYVKFLFATTEVHKVLPTIISRCQRFDLRRIPVPLIAQRLRQIAVHEGVFVSDAALGAIARCANGGMRDAQSLFDQMIAFCGGMCAEETINEQDVSDVFGLASASQLKEIACGIFGNQLGRALEVIGVLADNGRDLERVFADLIDYLRNLMLAGSGDGIARFIEVSSDELAELTALAKQIPVRMIQNALGNLIAQERMMREAVNKRITFEVIVAQATEAVNGVQLDDVLTHLNNISGLIPRDEIKLERRPVFTQTAVSAPVPATPVAPVAAAPVVTEVPTAPAPVAPVVSEVPVPPVVSEVPVPPAPAAPSAPVAPATVAPVAEMTVTPVPAPLVVPEAPVAPAPVVPVAVSPATAAPVAERPAAPATAAPVVPEVPSASEEDERAGEEPAAGDGGFDLTSRLAHGNSENSAAESPAVSGYRKATPEEFRKLAKLTAVKAVCAQFNCEPFDIRIKEK